MQTAQPKAIVRNDSLDYLRGLAASGVMAYHMHLLTFGEADASTFIARVKIYAVAIFYVLSGLTLFIANERGFEKNKEDLIDFYLKRFFRIFPLLWLATLFTYLLGSDPDMYTIKHLIVNIFIIPGALRPDGFMANGAWSIGNELFFYAFFPILFFLGRARKLWLYLAVAIIFIPFVVFAFKLIDPSIRLGHQWSKYTNPLNQFFFFAIGVLIASLVKPVKPWTKIALLLVLVLFVPVIFYPAAGEPVVLVTGLNRMALSTLTILICYFFYISDFAFLPAILRRFLKFLGDASFSIYLLHPLIHQIIHNIAKNLNIDLPPYLLITLTVLSTLITSYFVYNRFEKYFMKLGKNYIKKRRSNLVVNG